MCYVDEKSQRPFSLQNFVQVDILAYLQIVISRATDMSSWHRYRQIIEYKWLH